MGLRAAIREFIREMRETPVGTSPYDTVAEVKRIEDGKAWVAIPGGVPETPVDIAGNVSVGDKVQVRVSGGRAWASGNYTDPPEGRKATRDTRKIANNAGNAAEEAADIASEAQKVADKISQYFWFINGSGAEAGTHITEVPQKEFMTSPTGGNLLLRSNVVKLRMALITLAELTGSSLIFYDPNTNAERIKIDTNGVHMKGAVVSNNYSYVDILAQAFKIGYHSYTNSEDYVSEQFGYQGFGNYMYARKTMTNVPPSFRSAMLDDEGFRFIRDNGTNPLAQSGGGYLFESGYLKEAGMRVATASAGQIDSITEINAPAEDGDSILTSESPNGTRLVDIIYDEADDKASMELSGKIIAGAMGNGLFAETEETLINSASISAGGVNDNEISISNPGYYPLAISGIHSTTRYFCTIQFCLTNKANGSAKIDYMTYNPSSSSRTGTVKAKVLWLKTTA